MGPLTCVAPAASRPARLWRQNGDAWGSSPPAITAPQLPASWSLSSPTEAGTSGAGSLALLACGAVPARAHACMSPVQL